MLPTLRAGDLLLADRAAPPRPGDLVLARWSGSPLVVKRLLRREADGWWVERDNPAVGVDSWSSGAVAPDDLVAVVRVRLWPRPGRPVGPSPAARSRTGVGPSATAPKNLE